MSLDGMEHTLKCAEPRIDAALHAASASTSAAGAPGRSTGGGQHGQQQHGQQQQQRPQQQQQRPQQQQRGGRPHRRWVPTNGDALTPGVQPLPSAGLGCGGADLFSADHLIAHVRTAAEVMIKLEESKGWKQVAFGSLQMFHHRDKDSDVQSFKVHCVLEESMLVSSLRGCLGGGEGAVCAAVSTTISGRNRPYTTNRPRPTPKT
jgi:hypothetical protein